MSHAVKLPKWPRLLVRGRNVTRQQAEEIILRTTWIGTGATCNDSKWNRHLRRIFGVTARFMDDDFYSQWERAAKEIGWLDLSYIHNDHLASYSADGPAGWVNWGGQVYCPGMPLLGKWPTVGDVTDDWRKIAHAFPYLNLTAQLVGEEWDDPFTKVESFLPLVRWTVGNGAVELHDDPGEPLFEPSGMTHAEELDLKYENGPPPEHLVPRRQLRGAVQRVRRKVATG